MKPGWASRGVVAVLIVVLATALFVRLHRLSALPSGFHGDEAIVGLEAQRVLRDGHIGPYSPNAAGQPTGPIYLTALAIALFGDSVFAVRLVPALAGALTTLALFLILRRSLGALAALMSAWFLATMAWHIHFSRIGFPLASWPLVAVLTAGAATQAIRNGARGWWAVTGGLTGLGLYVYNAQPLYAAIVALCVIGAAVARRHEWGVRNALIGIALFLGSLALVVTPMARYALDDRNDYFLHFRRSSLLGRDEWQRQSVPLGKADFVLDGYVEFWSRVCCQPELDPVDGTGTTVLVPRLIIVLAGLGMALGIVRRRTPIVWLGALVVLVMPLGNTVTEGDLARRTLVIAPFVAMFTAIAVTEMVAFATRRRGFLRWASIASVATITALIPFQNLDLYFDDFAAASDEQGLLARDMRDASDFMARLPPGSRVYFYSEQWSIDYEVRQFLAPRVSGVDRSTEFGNLNFSIDRSRGRPVIVLLGEYKAFIDTIRERYPGGVTTIGGASDDITFIAYQP